ncbi:hypothetical protein RJD24_18560 [Bacillaceae bacterium IKA-2]|nr:hypothetical protein RJD24_18560 [Bacillaceae bacterium IKA-2]
MIDPQSVEIDFGLMRNQEIIQNLKLIYTTPAGTVPFDRDFGINWDILDQPLNIAKGHLIVEYAEKTRKYEPRASVREVYFLVHAMDGSLIPRVVIDFVGATE